MFWLQENLILMKEMSKKCSTDQRLIWKRNTTYKIGTLEESTIKFSFSHDISAVRKPHYLTHINRCTLLYSALYIPICLLCVVEFFS